MFASLAMTTTTNMDRIYYYGGRAGGLLADIKQNMEPNMTRLIKLQQESHDMLSRALGLPTLSEMLAPEDTEIITKEDVGADTAAEREAEDVEEPE